MGVANRIGDSNWDIPLVKLEPKKLEILGMYSGLQEPK